MYATCGFKHVCMFTTNDTDILKNCPILYVEDMNHLKLRYVSSEIDYLVMLVTFLFYFISTFTLTLLISTRSKNPKELWILNLGV